MSAAQLLYPDPELRDGAERLRRWDYGDMECVRLAATDPSIPQGTSVPAVFSPAQGRAFIERQWSRQTDGMGISLAIADEASNTAGGLIVALFRPQRRVVGIGYWVVPNVRGRGFARRAVALLGPWLLHNAGMARVEALVEPDNTPSRRTLERCGFRQEGLLRSYLDGERDALMYSLLGSDAPKR